MIAHPFLKWVGGKRQLLSQLLPFFPDKFHDYYEPFVGGGAVFFALTEGERISRIAYLSDFNTELITTYTVVRDLPERLIEELEYRKTLYIEAPEKSFYELRARTPTLDLHIAGRMISLNKTAFNGLYRVNKKGLFNAPWGKYTNPAICDPENIRACSVALKKTNIRSGDFEFAVENACRGDVVYFDPPYVPVNKTSNFTAYQADGFGMAEQERLARVFRDLVERGAYVLLSNSDTPEVRELYREYTIHTLTAKRSVNSDASKRGAVNEVLVVGGNKEGAM